MDLMENVPRGTKQTPVPDSAFEWELPESIPILPPNQDQKTISDRLRKEVYDSVEIAVKYKGYIEREKKLADKIMRLEDLRIPEGFDYDKVPGLSIECRQKLKTYNPRTLAQASRIPGVSPADISILLVCFGR